MDKHHQLVIIGAGPAGSYAALTAARRGLDVLLIERDPEVGQPLACAEAISVVGLTSFIEPDPSFIATDIYSLGFTVATGFAFTYRSTEQLGYVLHRPLFDQHIGRKAAEAGAALVTSTCADAIELSGDGPARIHLQTGNGSRWVTGDYVIAADGVESMIGRMAGIKTFLPLSRDDACLQYRVSGIDVDPSLLEFCVGKKYSPDGYLWVFSKSDRSANIGLGLNPAANDNGELRRILERFLKERYGKYTVEFESCGMVAKFVGFGILGRDNLLLAGDAARTVDSLTGAGIAKAMHTGRLAAQAVAAAVSGEIDRKNLVDRYRDTVKNEIGWEVRFLQKAYRVFRKFTDQDWESLARFLEKHLAKQKAGSINPAQIIKSAFIRVPRLIRLARHVL
jgi:digeranylgeranylglycerophospholipid reductase